MRISDWSSDVCSSDLSVRAVERYDCGSARLQPFENLALGVGDGLLRRKELAVGGSNPCDDRHMRTHEAGESGKLPRMVHAHFEHAIAAVSGHAGKAERPARVVVVAFDGGMDPARRAAFPRPAQRFLGARIDDPDGATGGPASGQGAGTQPPCFP